MGSLTTLSVKEFFLISSLSLPWCNLRPCCVSYHEISGTAANNLGLCFPGTQFWSILLYMLKWNKSHHRINLWPVLMPPPVPMCFRHSFTGEAEDKFASQEYLLLQCACPIFPGASSIQAGSVHVQLWDGSWPSPIHTMAASFAPAKRFCSGFLHPCFIWIRSETLGQLQIDEVKSLIGFPPPPITETEVKSPVEGCGLLDSAWCWGNMLMCKLRVCSQNTVCLSFGI